MNVARIAGMLAMCAVICAFFLYLFPPVYGPTTALRSKQAADALFLCIIFWGSLIITVATPISLHVLPLAVASLSPGCLPSFPFISVLRC
jgi:hypothetical protein